MDGGSTRMGIKEEGSSFARKGLAAQERDG